MTEAKTCNSNRKAEKGTVNEASKMPPEQMYRFQEWRTNMGIPNVLDHQDTRFVSLARHKAGVFLAF